MVPRSIIELQNLMGTIKRNPAGLPLSSLLF
jgi:hypothetical protein